MLATHIVWDTDFSVLTEGDTKSIVWLGRVLAGVQRELLSAASEPPHDTASTGAGKESTRVVILACGQMGRLKWLVVGGRASPGLVSE